MSVVEEYILAEMGGDDTATGWRFDGLIVGL